MAQVYKYDKIKYGNIGGLLAMAWIAVLKIIMKDIPPFSIVYLVPMVIGGSIIWWIARLIIRKTSRVEMDDVNLSRKVSSRTIWSVPILSITNTGQGMGSPNGGRYQLPMPMGYILKTNDGKFYTIPNNIANANGFIKDLQAKNPSLIVNQPVYDKALGIYTGTEMNREYIQKYGLRNIVIGIGSVIIVFAAVGYVIYKFSPVGSIDPTFTNDVNQAHNLWASGQYSQMVPVAQKALNEATDNKEKALAHYWLGVSYYKTNQLSQAETEELTSIQLDSSQSGPYITLAGVKAGQNDFTQEMSYAQKAVSLDPNYGWAHNALAIAYLNQGQKQEAIGEFQKAIQLDPSNATFKQNLQSVTATTQ